jgi:hypothetical protein
VDDKEKRFVEELLDASLRHYARAEPRPGLEGRVLAGVRARQRDARRRTFWGWAVGAAGASAVVTLLVFSYLPRHQTPPMPLAAKAPANISEPVVAAVAPPVHPARLHPSRRPGPPNRVDSRPQQFPTPRPLSEQEKLLLVYAQSLNGSSTASAWKWDHDASHDLVIPPLRIAAIDIEPLSAPENRDKK